MTHKQDANNKNTKWLLLALVALTGGLGMAAPLTSLSVLFDEISHELNLDLVQIGLIWGSVALPSIFSSLISGTLGDTLGPKRVIFLGIFLAGLAGASRGLASGFSTLLISVLFLGFMTPMVSANAFKLSGLLFPSSQLGLANGIFSMGLAMGFLIGSLFSATILSPLLGGWRNVMFFFGTMSVLLSIPWFIISIRSPGRLPTNAGNRSAILQSMKHIFQIRNVWLLGITAFGISGCFQGISGYLPLYLRGQGWTDLSADGALSMLNGVSMICVLPITMLSDRKRLRKRLLLIMVGIATIATASLSLVAGPQVWASVILSGFIRDTAIALIITMVLESDGVGARYSGTANGLVMMFLFAGNFVSSPIGNMLAKLFPGAPFLFWSAMAALGAVMLNFVHDSDSNHLEPEIVDISETIN